MAVMPDTRDTKRGKASPTTVMADGTPIGASPIWDAERDVLVIHTDRDAGSNYDHVDHVPADPAAVEHAKDEDRRPTEAEALEALTSELDAAVGTR
jgi:hypothetical protein